MIKEIDDFLNKTTMYRLVLYYLLFLFCAAYILSCLGFLRLNPLNLVVSAIIVTFFCLATNFIFSKVFAAPANLESTLITALILTLIITPITSLHDFTGISFLFWASVLAIASKYIIAIDKKHIFNPAAFAVAITAISLNLSASWWVGSLPMLPFVFLGGILVVRKMQRSDLVLSFIIIALLTTIGFSFFQRLDIVSAIWKNIAYSNLLFFAFVMITEPLTTPPNKKMQMVYGGIVGFLFSPQVSIFGFFFSPELALLIGNVFSYLQSPKGKYSLKLKEKVEIAPNMYDFVFSSDKKFNFKAGQYLELTLGHKKPDNRGIRRYFTIASSPTEENIRFGIKFNQESSSFKKILGAMKPGDELVAGQLAGEFVLPEDKKQKLVFIAGGIGVTPYRSMIKYLLDNYDYRTITVFYSNSLASAIVYSDIFDQAQKKMKAKIVYTLTNADSIPSDWSGQKGTINEQMIRAQIPDYADRLFYISGSNSMVVGIEKVLRKMGIEKKQIKTDFFPGFA